MGTSEPFEPDRPGNQIAPHDERHPDGPGAVGDEHVLQDQRIEVQAASFTGPLPSPQILDGYNDVVPGLAREIVDQWKAETAHRHQTITSIRRSDHEAMVKYYEGERQGRLFGFIGLLGLVAVAALAIVLDRQAVGIASLVTAGGAAIWALRRHSYGHSELPTRLDDEDSIETLHQANE